MDGKSQLTQKSSVGELYQTPVGHDILSKVFIQKGISEKKITNGFISRLKVKTFAKLTKRTFGKDFFETLLELANREKDVPFVSKGEIARKWWKEAVFYRIYSKCFFDVNGENMGEWHGIKEKLDYLKDLGVDSLWISSGAVSPNENKEDFYELLREVHKRDMHLMMDLNLEDAKTYSEMIATANQWLEKGVDGFSVNVINYLSKEEAVPIANENMVNEDIRNKKIGSIMGFAGIEHYFYGPKLHHFLREFREKVLEPHEAFSAWETPGFGMKMCQLVTGEERKELDMVFNFDHLEILGHVHTDDCEYDLNYYRDYMIDWMTNYGNNCWMPIFYNKDNNTRLIHKITVEKSMHGALAKLLAVMQFTLKGTPFILQGDELGIANCDFNRMNQIAGVLPWNKEMKGIHAGLEQHVKKDVFEAYQQLLSIRKADEALIYGDFEAVNAQKDRFVYRRTQNGKEYLIDCNLGKNNCKAHMVGEDYELVYPSIMNNAEMSFELANMKPYEARIWKKRKAK